MIVLAKEELKRFLDDKARLYNRPAFIEHDPICIPHQFIKAEDIEIAGFLAATIGWGNRASIIKNGRRLMDMMNGKPHRFLLHSGEKKLHMACQGFVHRTFNQVDCHYFFQSLQHIYRNHGGLSQVFRKGFREKQSLFDALVHFRHVFFEIPGPERTRKHVSDVLKNAAAKRLNMFLRWMVRKDGRGVDFGIWNHIPCSKLFIPLDVHTGNVARKMGLLSRKQNDWKAVEELTGVLRDLDPQDPVKYDYALFGTGLYEKQGSPVNEGKPV